MWMILLEFLFQEEFDIYQPSFFSIVISNEKLYLEKGKNIYCLQSSTCRNCYSSYSDVYIKQQGS